VRPFTPRCQRKPCDARVQRPAIATLTKPQARRVEATWRRASSPAW
jgi:hypothetical protein